jgi:hypothetical protein
MKVLIMSAAALVVAVFGLVSTCVFVAVRS